jgi:uncharacterized oxidoreductase
MQQVAAERLSTIARRVIIAMGATEQEAREVAEHLVEANLRGHDSHGVGMLPTYVRNFQAGFVRPSRSLETVADSGAVLAFDAGRGLGQPMANEAMRRGLARARELGAAVVALRNASHVGRVGTYGEQLAVAGMASVHFVNVGDHAPWTAPFGGSDARLGTNPFCAAAPAAEGEPLVLDMATSTIAFGKARVARNKGVPVPEGTVIDAQGRPTTDPTALVDEHKGALTAFGLHKGSGLAILCEVMSAAVGGGKSIAQPWEGGIINNMLSFIVDPQRLGSADAIRREITAVLDWVKASPPAPGVERVLVPGEPERLARARRIAEGVPLDPVTIEEILLAAEAVGETRSELARLFGA